MNFTSRKKRPLNREIEHLNDTSLIYIATEGQETEKQYFESSLFRNRRVQVRVLETQDGKSAPSHVFKRLKKLLKEIHYQENDRFWLMVDKDRTKEAHLSKVCSEAFGHKKIKINLAISNPCFELWLFLHNNEWVEELVSCKDIEKEIKRLLGSYNKSNIDISTYETKIDHAIKQAKILDKDPSMRWPDNPGTHVYKVVEEILKLID